MAIEPRDERENEDPKAYSWLWNLISHALLLTVTLGSFAAGAFMTFLAIRLLKDHGYWPPQINTKAAGEGGGVLFGMLPAYLISEYIRSRRQRRRVGFDVRHRSDASCSSPNTVTSDEESQSQTGAHHKHSEKRSQDL